MKKIMVAIPSWEWKLDPRIHAFLDNIKKEWEFELDVRLSKRMLVNRARNYMIDEALAKDYDYIWFMDDDNIPENADTLKILVDMDVDIATGIYTTRVGEKELILYRKTGWKPRYERIKKLPEALWPIQEVDWTGGWCLLVKMGAIRKLVSQFDIHLFEDKLTYFIDWEEYLFDKPITEKDLLFVEKCSMSWDITFCDRAKRLGYKIWVNLRCPLLHLWEPEVRFVDDSFYS